MLECPQGAAMGAAKTALGAVSIEEYLCPDFEPDADYVDGAIEERPKGVFDHAAWQRAILDWFMRHETEWDVLALPELRVRVAPTRFRVPDTTVLDRRPPREQIITQPPRAIFEVLSPEDRAQRMTRKLGDYAAMGVGEIWVVNPEGPEFFRFQDGELRRRAEFGRPGQAVHFPLNAIAELLPGRPQPPEQA